MKIEKREEYNVVVLLPQGDLVYEGVGEIETLLAALCNNVCNVVLNLSHVKYLSAKTLGLLAFYVKLFRDNQKELKLTNISNDIMRLLEVTGLLNVIEVFDNEKVALASMRDQVGKLEKSLLWSKDGLA